METCSKHKLADTMRDCGIIGYHSCMKPVYKDGLCKRHYERSVLRSIPWGQRDNYRPATSDDMKHSQHLKLASENANRIYSVRRNEVYQWSEKQKAWVHTTIHPDVELFVVKTL